jgi:hypothetical protein
LSQKEKGIASQSVNKRSVSINGGVVRIRRDHFCKAMPAQRGWCSALSMYDKISRVGQGISHSGREMPVGYNLWKVHIEAS